MTSVPFTPTPLIEASIRPARTEERQLCAICRAFVEGSIHKTAPISKIAFDDGLNNDLFEYQDGDLISEQQVCAKQTNFNKKDWLLENLLLNGTNTSEKLLKTYPNIVDVQFLAQMLLY
uniref:Uncharacterized protein n=1 Tax=Ditylenchus dipsaci TaxID=166011 RepID=A0A915E1B1_9BILA